MNTQTVSATGFARLAAQVDGVFCAACGISATALASALSQSSGLPFNLVMILGIGLIVYGLGLLAIASVRPVTQVLTRTVLTGNIIWIVLSAALLAFDPFGLTQDGRLLVIIIAAIVGGLAVWQFNALRRLG